LRALLRAWRRQLLGLNLSVVIPTLDAGERMQHCLDALDGADEIIVADGGSADLTRATAEAAGVRVLLAPRGRGEQLRAGAAAAGGDWLLFLHADTRLGRGWRRAVSSHLARHPGEAACFHFRLDDSAWQARLVERGVSLRTRLFGLPYGDQGLLLSRALYDAVGGYRPLPLMEDVDIVRRIGRRRIRMLPADAVTSAERWRRDGWLRRSATNLKCLILYRLGVAPEKIARIYNTPSR
jgi:rSAM/selenodomain-associated transferase 2